MLEKVMSFLESGACEKEIGWVVTLGENIETVMRKLSKYEWIAGDHSSVIVYINTVMNTLLRLNVKAYKKIEKTL